MEQKMIVIRFEVDDETTPKELHEWLCKAIHEGSEDELQQLTDHVIDIDLVENAN